MSQKSLFDVSAVSTSASKKKAHKTKNTVVLSREKNYIGLNDIWKDFGNYIKNLRSNKTPFGDD